MLAIASVPAVFVVGSGASNLIYRRLLFQGYDIGDLMPGDGNGIVVLTWMVCGLLLAFDLMFWVRIYRRVSGRQG